LHLPQHPKALNGKEVERSEALKGTKHRGKLHHYIADREKVLDMAVIHWLEASQNFPAGKK